MRWNNYNMFYSVKALLLGHCAYTTSYESTQQNRWSYEIPVTCVPKMYRSARWLSISSLKSDGSIFSEDFSFFINKRQSPSSFPAVSFQLLPSFSLGQHSARCLFA